MFRDCYFEFAGKSSEDYNLKLFYLDNNRDTFDSGGGFDIKSDSIPYSYEQFLYGKDYSEKPLEFEIEIINPDSNIPYDEMAEIKNWLFGQEGWCDLFFLDETQRFHLKCILIPSEDITDVLGYRGVRCTIHNASPFWYGDEQKIVINKTDLTANVRWDSGHTWDRWCTFIINVPNNGYVDIPIYPIIEINPSRNTNKNQDGVFVAGTYFALANTPATTLADGIAYEDHNYKIEEDSRISCDLQYMLENGITEYNYTEVDGIYSVSINGSIVCTVTEEDNLYKIFVSEENVDNRDVSDYTNLDNELCKPVVAALNYLGYRVTSDSKAIRAIDTLEINAKYATAQSELYPNLFIPITVNLDLPKPIFRLHYGTNLCRIYYGHIYDSITIRYTPLYRMGAF